MRIHAILAVMIIAGMLGSVSVRAALPLDATGQLLEQRAAGGAYQALAGAVLAPEKNAWLAIGTLSPGGQLKPDKDTRFELGSLSKVFTGVLLAEAVLRGEVRLEDSIAAYLPDTDGSLSPGVHGITLLQLATHSSGLPRLPTNFAPAAPADPYASYGEEDLLAALRQEGLVSGQPGAYVYSNFGSGLLGYVLARAAGTDYASLLQKRVFTPLSMHDSLVAPASGAAEGVAPGHDSAGEPAAHWHARVLAGCMGVISTPRDLVAFARANLDPASAGPLGSALELAMQPQRFFKEQGIAMGLGWHILDLDGPMVFHDGGTGGFRSFLGLLPERGEGVVLLSNTANDVSSLGMHVLEPRIPLQDIPKAKELTQEELEAYAGRYRLKTTPHSGENPNKSETILLVELKGNGLRYRAEGQARDKGALLVPVGDDTFIFKSSSSVTVTFGRDADGLVDSLLVLLPGESHNAVRME